jgi:hypothetical protein
MWQRQKMKATLKQQKPDRDEVMGAELDRLEQLAMDLLTELRWIRRGLRRKSKRPVSG